MSKILPLQDQAKQPTAKQRRTKQPAKKQPHRKTTRNKSWLLGWILVGTVLTVAVVSQFWTPYKLEDRVAPRLSPPSWEFLAGTDRLGRDLFTQLMLGSYSALIVAVGAVAIASVLGISIGLLAAANSRVYTVALLSVMDLMIAFPTLLLAMLLVTVRGASQGTAIVAIGISGAAVIARVTRINAARCLQEDYILAAVSSGVGWWSIQIRHIIPNIWPMLLVQLALLAGGSILAEASLSYLGLGTPPPQASWGRMLREAQTTISVSPFGALLSGLAIALTVLGINLLADGLREKFDPTVEAAS